MAFYFMCVWYFPIVWRPPLYREVVFEQNIGFAKELWFNASPQLELDTASKKMYLWCTFNFKKFILHFIISNIFILHFTYTFIHFTESRTLVSGAGHTSRLADVLKGKCFWIFSLSRFEFRFHFLKICTLGVASKEYPGNIFVRVGLEWGEIGGQDVIDKKNNSQK